MIAVDTNILVYAHREDSQFHIKASACISSLSEGTASWAIPWPCVHEFLAITTRPRNYNPPTPLPLAIRQIEMWMESPALSLLAESGRHWPELCEIALAGRVTGALIHDARVVAICRQHGVRELWTADRDFGRFSGLRIINPLLD